MSQETKGMIAGVIGALIVLCGILIVSRRTQQDPSWKMLSRGADSIFRDLNVIDQESAQLCYITRDKPGGSDLGWELQKVMMRAREAKWIAKEVGEKMRVLHEQEERRKVLDKTNNP